MVNINPTLHRSITEVHADHRLLQSRGTIAIIGVLVTGLSGPSSVSAACHLRPMCVGFRELSDISHWHAPHCLIRLDIFAQISTREVNPKHRGHRK